MDALVLGFDSIDAGSVAAVGGKGANLGELSRVDGVEVPAGFCVTTAAYAQAAGGVTQLPALLAALDGLAPTDLDAIGAASARIREAIVAAPLPDGLADQVRAALATLGADDAYAVRSSATAEDLATASFAGQQDTYLNIIGADAILAKIRECWASLFTDRAVAYRIQNGFDHAGVELAVVVQKMVLPDAAGIMFTASPITSDRTVVSIDASFGLGEALVSGLVDADNYLVRAGAVVTKTVATKKLAIEGVSGGGTVTRELDASAQHRQTLTDAQIVELASLGRRIEAHFGRPQDIEWCVADGQFYVVQARPITTLYPVPENPDGKNRVYMSFSHQQMMTDAMSPMGMSFFPIWFKKLTSDPVAVAGGRMYMDVSTELSSALNAKTFVNTGLGSVDTLIQKALKNVLARTAYVKTLPKGKVTFGITGMSMGAMVTMMTDSMKIQRRNDGHIVDEFMARDDADVRKLGQDIAGKTGVELLDFILADLNTAFDSIVVAGGGMGAVWFLESTWLEKNLKKWIGETGVIDTLSQSVPNNITTLMGYELLDLADAIRPYPVIVDYLRTASDDTFFTGMTGLDGAESVTKAFNAFLDKYGARGPAEIDIMRPRWAEAPTLMVPILLTNIENFEAGAHTRLFSERRQDAENKAADMLARIAKLPGGKSKAKKAEKKISVFRNFVGFREYPKYAVIRRFFVYKQAMLHEGQRLVDAGVLKSANDIAFLTFDELRDVVRTGALDDQTIASRKVDQEGFEKLTPPRVMTSDGEIVPSEYDSANAPTGSLVGMAASAGVVEGRANVVERLEDAKIADGDILVTAFTDPSWTPLFVSIAGLVTEVGGMMTHGSVVAREYALPAVVSVENATRRIRDGQRIRVNGTAGYVEILDEA